MFEAVAPRFADACGCRCPAPVSLLALVRVTKTPRSAYDALMLQLHDRMKGDDEFQRARRSRPSIFRRAPRGWHSPTK